jgi:hypothetical protein
MPSVSLKAHYDGTAIRLDEPFELPEGAQLLVTVLETDELERERAAWVDLGRRALAGAYGDSEPEYTSGDLLP